MSQAVKPYTIIHPKKDKDTGEEETSIGLVTLNKPLSSLQDRLAPLMKLDGLDQFNPAGRYSFTVMIASTFDVDKVWEEIKEQLEVLTAGVLIVGNFQK